MITRVIILKRFNWLRLHNLRAITNERHQFLARPVCCITLLNRQHALLCRLAIEAVGNLLDRPRLASDSTPNQPVYNLAKLRSAVLARLFQRNTQQIGKRWTRDQVAAAA